MTNNHCETEKIFTSMVVLDHEKPQNSVYWTGFLLTDQTSTRNLFNNIELTRGTYE